MIRSVSMVALAKLSSTAKILITMGMPAFDRFFKGEGRKSQRGHFLQLVIQQEIDDTLRNPLNGFIVGDVRLAAQTLKEKNATELELLPAHQNTDHAIGQIAAQLKAKATPTNADTLKSSQQKLKKHADKVSASFKQAKQLEGQLNQLHAQVEALPAAHKQAWQSYQQEYCEKLQHGLVENGVLLNQVENNDEDVLRDEPITETLKRYEELGLALPVAAKELPAKASHFFYLRAWLATWASLGSRQEPNTPADVNQALEKIKLTAFLKEADKSAEQLRAKQQKEIKSIEYKLAGLKQQAQSLGKELNYVERDLEHLQQEFHISLPQQISAKGLEQDWQPTVTTATRRGG